MTVTAATMATHVLRKLTVLEGAATPSAEDQATALACVRAVYEKLRDLEIAWWSDDEAPMSMKEDLARYVACHCAGELIPARAAQYIAENQRSAEREITRLAAAGERTNLPTQATYF